MSRVYVAAKFESKLSVRLAYGLLRAAGHEITHDWTCEDADDPDLNLRAAAEADLRGVRSADAVLLIHHPNGRGMYVEMGAALAYGIPVFAVGAREVDSKPVCIFYRMPRVYHYDTIEKAASQIGPLLRVLEMR